MAKKKRSNAKKNAAEAKAKGVHIEKLERKLNSIHRANRDDSVLRIKGSDNRNRRAKEWEDQTQANADYWVKCLLDPFAGAAHFPEPAVQGTDVSALHSVGNVHPGVTAGAESVTACMFYPGLKSYAKCVSSATAVNNVTWTPYDHAKMASLGAVAAGYRVTGMGVRVYNRAPMLNRNGRLFVGRFPPASNDPLSAPPPNFFDLIRFSDTIQVFDLAELPPEGIELFWIPMTTQGYVETTEHLSIVKPNFTALGYKALDSYCIDNRFFFFAVSDAGNPAEIFTDHVLNVEFIPHAEDQYLFEPKAVLAGPEAIAESFSHVVTKAKKHGLGNVIKNGVKSLAAGAVREFKNFASNTFKSGLKQIAKTGLEGLALGALMLDDPRKRHFLNRSVMSEAKDPRSRDDRTGTPRGDAVPLPRRRGSVDLEALSPSDRFTVVNSRSTSPARSMTDSGRRTGDAGVGRR